MFVYRNRSPNFAGSLMGLTNTLANIMSILGPITVGYILTETNDVDVSTTHLSDIQKISTIHE